jgi:Ca-activated chloride channel family protein
MRYERSTGILQKSSINYRKEMTDMTTALSYEMTTSRGVKIPLVKTSIQGELRDTALETTVIQHYRNNEQETIEAVYTFPLPVGATLLSLSVNLNGKTLTGTVVASGEAEVAYEDAITDGDTALLLQQINEALYTLNIGNLQPGDAAVISIRYIQLLRWQQNSLRIICAARHAAAPGARCRPRG